MEEHHTLDYSNRGVAVVSNTDHASSKYQTSKLLPPAEHELIPTTAPPINALSKDKQVHPCNEKD
eukprot:13978788-Ditylum_brightwellii.AAC.1